MEKTNEIQLKAPFYTYRGVTKCLSAGISFLTDNFLHIVKLSLPFAVSFAVVMSAITYVCSNSLFQKILAGQVEGSEVSAVTLFASLGVLYVLMFVIVVLFMGLIFRLVHIYTHDLPLKKYKYLPTLKSSLKYSGKIAAIYAVVLVLSFVFGMLSVVPFLFGGEGNFILGIKLLVSLVVIVALLVFALPLNIALPAMIFEKGKPAKTAWYGYKKGLKIWGKVFCLNLLIGILGMFIMFVLSMPSLTMISSFNAATLSQMNGDSVQLPAGFNMWYVIVLFITYYLFSFMFWIQSVPYCYLYASIKHDEIEEAKNQYKI